MSDPVTNVEIEDVLSSIRRLVSSDARPANGASAGMTAQTDRRTAQTFAAEKAGNAAPDASAEPEKLVLTPSLRVDDAAPAPGDAPVTLSDDLRVDLGGDAPADTSDQDMADAGDDWDDHVDAPQPEEEAMQARLARQDSAPDEMAELDRTEETGDGSPAADTEGWRPEKLKLRVAELEEVVARQADQWEPDGPGEDANSGGPVAPLPWEDYMPDGEDAPGEPGSDNAKERQAESKAGSAPEKAIEDAIAKAAMPKPAEAEEPSKAKAATTPEDEHIPDNFVAEEAGDTSAAARATDDDETDFLSGNDEFLDEDALRDLVADIVRQELQGALGERITRNVRKLVRREIHRALASQELQ
ncbi:hypothetical protein [Roseovarius nanhaiticus]|uniref:hypothetical protein n=1 Tax=Roseovarius nanhaiticus TaxID=573024 RepID=UPI002491F6C3|nr:hypothetical protein [Roseovarius nanhaiticus]